MGGRKDHILEIFGVNFITYPSAFFRLKKRARLDAKWVL